MSKFFNSSFAIFLILLGALNAQAQFGSEVQSTPSASINYNSGTGTFTYSDSPNQTDDDAYLPLIGSAASVIGTTSNWNATLTPTLTARTLTSTGELTSDVGIALGIFATVGSDSYIIGMSLGQTNNTGSTGNTDYPDNSYGTFATFSALKNQSPLTTTPLGSSVSYNGNSDLLLTTGTSSVAASESVAGVSGILGLSFNASSDTLTGSYNGANVGSFSLAGLGAKPLLVLGVAGFSGEFSSSSVPAVSATATKFAATPEPSTYEMMLIGLSFLGFALRRQAVGHLAL